MRVNYHLQPQFSHSQRQEHIREQVTNHILLVEVCEHSISLRLQGRIIEAFRQLKREMTLILLNFYSGVTFPRCEFISLACEIVTQTIGKSLSIINSHNNTFCLAFSTLKKNKQLINVNKKPPKAVSRSPSRTASVPAEVLE